ncbi:MAG: ferric reductase-like transmembrane domain-containing protein, partial [Acidimicrobiia bacterium]|nr:ferric reductase-like transmembrane domain-containing protein [Acidimicrobiia bacterium]
MSPQIWWYVARAAGVIAWLLLTASVLWGILLPAKVVDRLRPAWILDLHRWLAGLTVGFVVVHLGALVADTYIHFDLVDLAIPFVADWKPIPVALGVLATWLLVIVELTSLAMKRLPRRTWHRIHLASYLTFFLASLHGTLAGTDAANPLYQVTSILAVVA